MATNTFKNAILASVGTTASNVYVAPAGNTSIMLELDLANRTGSAITANVTIRDVSAGTTAFIVQGAPIPAGGALQVVSGQKIVLEAGDYVQVQSSAASSLDAVGSLLTDV